jgi:hypothetical protein
MKTSKNSGLGLGNGFPLIVKSSNAMISELQNSVFIRSKVGFVRTLARDLTGGLLRRLVGQEEIVTEDDMAEAAASLEMLENERDLWEPPSNYWLPRNAYGSIFQSSLDHFYRATDSTGKAENEYGESLTKDHLISSNVQSPKETSDGMFKLNRRDPRWVAVTYAKTIKLRKGRPAFPDGSIRCSPIKSKARIILLADWGSGIPRAEKLAQTVSRLYLKPAINQRELHVVHMGDVYYAGLDEEYLRNFLLPWPVGLVQAQTIASWCIPGNHDMYSGGHGFFQLLKDQRFHQQGGSSYFLLENKHWQIFGLDTGYDPRDYKGDKGELYGEQAAWVAQKRSAAPQKKCVVLSHHQPFSAYQDVSEELERRLRPILNAHQIDAWFWGHEHLSAVYDPHQNVRFPVLIGNGGFPEKPKKLRKGAPSLKHNWRQTNTFGNLLFGFAVLDFDGDRIDMQLVDENGKVQFAEAIS